MPFHIAIDGPVAAGKGTVSRLVAKRLGFLYVDTGAMYRVAALLAHRNQLPFEHEDALVGLVKHHTISMRPPSGEEDDGRLSTVLLDGEDVSWKIRTEVVSQGSSIVATHKKLREELVRRQQEIAGTQHVVMEGRDITFRVLPHAHLKIFMTASDKERAKRRHLELQMKGIDVSFEDVYQDLLKRDSRDMGRDVDPLQVVADAWVLDTSAMTIEAVVDTIVEKAQEMMTHETF